MAIQFFQSRLLPFSHYRSWFLCYKLIAHICVRLFLGSLFCFMITVSVFMPIPYWLCQYHTFIFIVLWNQQVGVSSFVLLSQDSYDCSWTFFGHFRIFICMKNAIEIIVRIALNMHIALGSMGIFIVLILPIH